MSRVRCPGWTCRSTDCSPLVEKKKYSVGKGSVGAGVGFLIGGPIGGLVGAATGVNGKKKVKMMCNQCGRIFEIKV